MNRSALSAASFAALALWPCISLAAGVYTSEAAFIADAGTAKAALPAVLGSTSGFSAAPLAFTSDALQAFVIDTPQYGQPIAGEDNLLLSGYESHTITSSVPLYAFGFKIFQPSNGSPASGTTGVACYFPCDAGAFKVSLSNGATPVADFSFTPAYDAVEFHGYAGTMAFDTIRIEDALGTIDDEYFAIYRYSTTPVPEPGTWALMALGLAGLSAARRRPARVTPR